MAKIVKLILVRERRGLEKENDPIRTIQQLWTENGNLVAEEEDKYSKNKHRNNFEMIF